MAGARQHFVQPHLAILHPQSEDSPECKARITGFADRGVGGSQDAGGFRDTLIFPIGAPVILGQGIE